MAEVYHDAEVVHLAYHLLPEAAHTVVGVASAGRVADVVVTVVAERDINHATLCEVFYVLELMLQGEAVLDGEHDAFASLALVFVEVGRRTRYADVALVLLYDVLNFVEDEVGIDCRRKMVKCVCKVWIEAFQSFDIDLRGECLADLRLREVGCHCNGILPSFGHLVQIVEYPRVTLVEPYALWKEHRRVAVCVECEYTLVELLGEAEVAGLCHQPSEEFSSFFSHPFRVPLYAHDRFVLRTFDGLYDSVRRKSRHAEPFAGVFYRLMMEGVDHNLLFLIECIQYRRLRKAHTVCLFTPVSIL